MTLTQVNSTLGSHRFRVGLAFAAIYLIWGSTYLAIRFAIETIPPFLMGGARFTIAGLVLYSFARGKGEARPRRSDLKAGAIIGALMVVLGNGLVIWSEQFVPSGLAAVMVATGPFWLVMIDWWLSGRKPLPATTIAGLVIGFGGVTLLTMLGSGLSVDESRGMVVLSAIVVTLAAFSWAAGSMYARNIQLKVSLTMLLGIQMISGGLMLIGLGTLTGEWSGFELSSISLISAGALGYLVIMGTLVGYSAYLWLMRVSEPARVSTHGYVNPVVAVFLGWAVAGEPLTVGMIVATATILFGVGLINARTFRFERRNRPPASGRGKELLRRLTTPKLINNPELAMIARTWQGVVPTEKADAYNEYLHRTGVSACRAINGNRGVYVMRREEEPNTRFLFISLWDSMEAIKAFAGEEPEIARYFPEDREYLLEMVPNVEHYEVM